MGTHNVHAGTAAHVMLPITYYCFFEEDIIMHMLFCVRTWLVALSLIAFWQVPFSAAQTSCPLRPALPAKADFDDCTACFKTEYDQRESALTTEAIAALSAAAATFVKSPTPATCYALGIALTGILVKNELKGMDTRKKCRELSTCKKVITFQDDLERYKKAVKQCPNCH
jgi:hypothetical protein